MTHNFNLNTKNNDEWLTPPDIVKTLGPFNLDPCAPIIRPWPTANVHYTKEDNGLAKTWHGRVWLNPPYGKDTFKWLNRLAIRQQGIALIFARTDTKGFHKEVLQKATSIFFFEGRLNFHYVDGTRADRANAPSCLVSYSHTDTDIIDDAGLRGYHIILRY